MPLGPSPHHALFSGSIGELEDRAAKLRIKAREARKNPAYHVAAAQYDEDAKAIEDYVAELKTKAAKPDSIDARIDSVCARAAGR